MLDLRSMFCDFNSHPGYIKYLPLLIVARFHFFQHTLAVTALLYSMNLDAVWILYCFQSISCMSWLTTTFLAMPFP
jgi:hypothetical protein